MQHVSPPPPPPPPRHAYHPPSEFHVETRPPRPRERQSFPVWRIALAVALCSATLAILGSVAYEFTLPNEDNFQAWFLVMMGAFRGSVIAFVVSVPIFAVAALINAINA